MKDLLVFGLCLFGLVKDSISAPALISQMGDSFDESSINNDTNPDPCYIAGNIYYHGQQISRQDECEFCLCVDGEMFCYWQCPDDDEDKETDSSANPAKVRSTTPRQINNTPATGADVLNATVPELPSSSETSSVQSISIESSTVVSTSEKPVSCFVLGVEYKLGEVLPHNTGTCLECKCGSDGRVTCSPNDCVASEPQDEMFNSHHQDSNSLDMFDVDMF
uniref:Uncharacterized protein n=1 Tax=Cacopsylla melanoneura TaxID=428564 RepID=A0A8D8YK93_9HEMI